MAIAFPTTVALIFHFARETNKKILKSHAAERSNLIVGEIKLREGGIYGILARYRSCGMIISLVRDSQVR